MKNINALPRRVALLAKRYKTKNFSELIIDMSSLSSFKNKLQKSQIRRATEEIMFMLIVNNEAYQCTVIEFFFSLLPDINLIPNCQVVS